MREMPPELAFHLLLAVVVISLVVAAAAGRKMVWGVLVFWAAAAVLPLLLPGVIVSPGLVAFEVVFLSLVGGLALTVARR